MVSSAQKLQELWTNKIGSLEDLVFLRHRPRHQLKHVILALENINSKENGSCVLRGFGAKISIKWRNSDAYSSWGYFVLAGAWAAVPTKESVA